MLKDRMNQKTIAGATQNATLLLIPGRKVLPREVCPAGEEYTTHSCTGDLKASNNLHMAIQQKRTIMECEVRRYREGSRLLLETTCV